MFLPIKDSSFAGHNLLQTAAVFFVTFNAIGGCIAASKANTEVPVIEPATETCLKTNTIQHTTPYLHVGSRLFAQ